MIGRHQKRDPVTGQFEARTYEVTVWNVTNGDVEKYLSDATEKELQEVESFYEDEPFYEIQVEPKDIDDF